MADRNRAAFRGAALGKVGAFLPAGGSIPVLAEQREAARRLEEAGYGATWVNEVIGGKDALVQLGLLLDSTERMAFGTSIANVWARAPQTAHAGAAFLAQAFPGRVALGLGAGYPGQAASVGRDFEKPVPAMRDYLERMAMDTDPPAVAGEYPRIVGATGPRMLALARDLSDGAIPAMMPPTFTAHAREVLGPEKLLVVMVQFVLDGDRRRAQTGVAATVEEHLDAGADHVVLATNELPFDQGIEALTSLRGALAEDAPS